VSRRKFNDLLSESDLTVSRPNIPKDFTKYIVRLFFFTQSGFTHFDKKSTHFNKEYLMDRIILSSDTPSFKMFNDKFIRSLYTYQSGLKLSSKYDNLDYDKILLANYIHLNTIGYLTLPGIFFIMPKFYNFNESEDYSDYKTFLRKGLLENSALISKIIVKSKLNIGQNLLSSSPISTYEMWNDDLYFIFTLEKLDNWDSDSNPFSSNFNSTSNSNHFNYSRIMSIEFCSKLS